MGSPFSRLFITSCLMVMVIALHPSCELIDPDEKIPSFIHIDTIALTTTTVQGAADHNIVDAWLYENEQLVGVYEMPADIPILQEGSTPIRIRPGIKVNGQVGSRSVNPFLTDFQSDVILYPDSHLVINPTVSYRSTVNFAWIEEFEDQGVSLAATSFSENELIRIEGEDAYQQKTALFHLSADQERFEVMTDNAYWLPPAGAPVILEFTYRCNNSLVVGLFSRDASQTIQFPILVLSPTEEWNHVYVSLSDVVSSSTNYLDHRPFFGFLRDDGNEGEIDVYVDNIKLMY